MKPFPEYDPNTLKARKFIIWLLVISSFMFFAALTSGFIVYAGKSEERGLNIALPHMFYFSTAAIILSSVTMHLSYLAAKKSQLIKQRQYLIGTILLGLAFFILQLFAWQALIQQGVYLVSTNASQSFLYIFTGAHLLHILFGIGMIGYTLFGSFKNSVTHNIFRVEVTSIFWHFVDILWIYLYVFLILGQ